MIVARQWAFIATSDNVLSQNCKGTIDRKKNPDGRGDPCQLFINNCAVSKTTIIPWGLVVVVEV
jgi:hypothetical protein